LATKCRFVCSATLVSTHKHEWETSFIISFPSKEHFEYFIRVNIEAFSTAKATLGILWIDTLVEQLSLLLVAQHSIGFCNFLESGLGGLLLLWSLIILIRVPLKGQLLVSFSDFIISGRLLHSQYLILILLLRHLRFHLSILYQASHVL